jgi:hypothetical protein
VKVSFHLFESKPFAKNFSVQPYKICFDLVGIL